MNTYVIAFTQRLERHCPNKEKEKKKGGRKYIWSEEIEAAVRRKKSFYVKALSTKKTEDRKN